MSKRGNHDLIAGIVLGAILAPLAQEIGQDLVRHYRGQRRKREAMRPLAVQVICQVCERPATRVCRKHGSPCCGDCDCPECVAMRQRIADGAPRKPIPVAQFAPPLPAPAASPLLLTSDGVQVCQRCGHVSPPEASHCWFDGELL